MIVGILQFDLHMPWAESLKDKRRVVRSLKDRLHREMMVSVAEIAFQDLPTVARLGVACVASDGRRAGEVLDHVLEAARREHEAQLGATSREILRATGDELPDLGEQPDGLTAEIRRRAGGEGMP